MKVNSYQDLIVWQKSIELVDLVYKCTSEFPKDERFGLISQMRRSAVSIPSNIAEGRLRGSRIDFARFISMSLGSCAELQTQTIISSRQRFLIRDQEQEITKRLIEITKMLHAFHRKLKPRT